MSYKFFVLSPLRVFVGVSCRFALPRSALKVQFLTLSHHVDSCSPPFSLYRTSKAQVMSPYLPSSQKSGRSDPLSADHVQWYVLGIVSTLGNTMLTMVVLLRWPPSPKKVCLNKQAVKLALDQSLEPNQENVLTTTRD